MTLKDLSEGLRELAGDVRPVDLHARAIRTSRRMRAQRAAAVMTGGLALVLVIVVGLSLSWHRPEQGGGIDAADQSMADATASATPYGDSGEDLAVLARVGYYVMPTAPDVYGVFSWEPGSAPRLEISGDADFASSVAISPSGQYAAYYVTGRMAVADLTGEEPAEPEDIVFSTVGNGDPCLAPTWRPDGSGVVLSAQGGKTATLVDFTDSVPSVADIYRPQGCDAQVFTYGTDASYAFASMIEETSVTWEDADDGTPVRTPVDFGNDPGSGYTRLTGVSADGTVLCLADGSDPEMLPVRPVCSALVTAQKTVDAKLPVEGELDGAAFLNGGYIPASSGGSETGANDGSISLTFTQDVMLRMRMPDDGYVIAQAAYQTDEASSKEFGELTVTEFALVDQVIAEPPELAGASLLTFAL